MKLFVKIMNQIKNPHLSQCHRGNTLPLAVDPSILYREGLSHKPRLQHYQKALPISVCRWLPVSLIKSTARNNNHEMPSWKSMGLKVNAAVESSTPQQPQREGESARIWYLYRFYSKALSFFQQGKQEAKDSSFPTPTPNEVNVGALSLTCVQHCLRVINAPPPKKKKTWESVPMELTKWPTYFKHRVYLQAVVVFKKLKITETSEKQDLMIIYCL